MKRRMIVLIVLLSAFSLSVSVALSAKPDFSGTWVMDRSRSIGLPPGMDQTMIVLHKGDKIEIETRLLTAQGEQTIKDGYTLDGKEAEFTPQGPGAAPGSKGKRTAVWLPRGNGIVVSEETIAQTDKGPVTRQLKRKWILSPDGNTLTIDMYFDGPNGSFETKRIFIRKTG